MQPEAPSRGKRKTCPLFFFAQALSALLIPLWGVSEDHRNHMWVADPAKVNLYKGFYAVSLALRLPSKYLQDETGRWLDLAWVGPQFCQTNSALQTTRGISYCKGRKNVRHSRWQAPSTAPLFGQRAKQFRWRTERHAIYRTLEEAWNARSSLWDQRKR